MNNREWLNTLSDEDWLKEINELQFRFQICGTKMNYMELESLRQYIQAEHTTTADESFSEIGFIRYKTDEKQIQYSDEGGTTIYIQKTGEFVTTNYKFFDLKYADQIRKIADKKRKEMGW